MSLGQRLVHEIRQIGLVSLYFLICFSFFLLLKKLLLEEYQISVYVFHAAIVGALVTAKVVVVLDKTSFGSRFQNSRLVFHVLWRTLLYTGAVFIVTLIEQFIDVYFQHGNLRQTARNLFTGKDFDHYLALNLAVALSFLIYNTASELDRRIGRGSIRRLLLAPPALETGAPAARPGRV